LPYQGSALSLPIENKFGNDILVGDFQADALYTCMLRRVPLASSLMQMWEMWHKMLKNAKKRMLVNYWHRCCNKKWT